MYVEGRRMVSILLTHYAHEFVGGALVITEDLTLRGLLVVRELADGISSTF